MQNVIIDYVYLILIILGLVMIANKMQVAYPIVLVLGGVAISLVPAFRNIAINPELVFFIFLPPLLYEAAWHVSWKEFWKWRRAIVSFAFPIVIITSCVIAFVSVSLIPGFTLALGFLLGGIISPPDAISTSAIMRKVKAPKSIISIAEGESLLNDASSLIVFRFALAAVITGQFYFQKAATNFFVVVFMGILIGIIVGIIFYYIHRWLPVTPRIEIILTIVTPYCMYYAAEHYHFSGILAVKHFGWSGRSMGIYAIHNWILNVINGRVNVTVEESMEGLLANLFKNKLTSDLDSSFEKWLLLLKEQCEKDIADIK